MRAEPLLGELNGDCFTTAFKVKSLGHRLVNRACARRLCCFHSNANQFLIGGAFPTELFRLRPRFH
jgi:hypothetical protein